MVGFPKHSCGWIILLPPEGDRLSSGDSVRPLRGRLELRACKTGLGVFCLFLDSCVNYTSARECVHTHRHECFCTFMHTHLCMCTLVHIPCIIWAHGKSPYCQSPFPRPM